MCQPSQPIAPSAGKIAKAQTKSNQDTALYQAGLNQTDQVTPYGSLTYTSKGGGKGKPPHVTATTSLDPKVQAVVDALISTQGKVAGTAKTLATQLPGSLVKIKSPKLQTSLGPDDFSSDRQRVEDTLFGELDQQSAKDRATLDASLADKGIAIGSDAYTRATGDFQKSLSNNRTAAILNAGTEQNRMQQLALNSAGFGNNALTQQLQNQITGNNQNLNQVLSLTNGTQIQQPSFASTPQTGVGGTDVAGITQQGVNNATNAYNQQQQSLGSFFGTLGTLGSAALPFLL